MKKNHFKLSLVRVISLVSLFLGSVDCLQVFVEVPRNTSVKYGEDVTLRCSVRGQKGEVVWCKDDFCTFGRQRNISDARFSIQGSENMGEHHLYIKNVTMSDNSKYQCQVTATDTEKAIKSDPAFLTVLVEPKSLIIISNNPDSKEKVRLISNKSTIIECISDSANPGCDFNWFLNSVQLKAGPEVTFMPTINQKIMLTQLFKSTGKINLKPNLIGDWSLKELKCECNNLLTVNYPDKKFFDTKTVLINYAPVVSVKKIKQDDELIPDVYVEFYCMATGEPPVKSYKWFIDSKVYSEGPDEKYLYLKIEENMDSKMLKCEAKNDVASTVESYTLALINAPKIVQELPSHQVVRLNEPITLTCDVKSNPASSIIWTLNESVIYAYPKLTISSMRPENYGTYTCTASLKDFPKVSSSSILLPPGPPKIEATERQFAFFGSKGTVECLFEKEPKPTEVEWYQANRRIDVNRDSKKFQIKEHEVARKGTKSVLFISEVSQTDYVNYTCKGLNAYGMTNKTIFLEAKAYQHNSIIPVTLIVFFLFVICSIIAFFSYTRFFELEDKKRKKNFTIKRERFGTKPSFMLNTISGRYTSYPRRNGANMMMNMLKNRELYNRQRTATRQVRRPVRLNVDRRRPINPRTNNINRNPALLTAAAAAQTGFNPNESFNYFTLEKNATIIRTNTSPADNINNPSGEIYYDDQFDVQEREYVNELFQTDV